MKRVAILFCAIFFIASCKQNMEKNEIKVGEYGTVLLDFTNNNFNLRAVGANGLPEFKSSRMKLVIEQKSKTTIEREYSERDEKKYKGKFPIGSEIKLTVIVIGKSGQWKGEANLKVQKGENLIFIKLKKSAFSLQALKFKLDKNTAGQGELTFKLGFEGGIPFFNETVSSLYEDSLVSNLKIYTTPAFCRDRLGRIYILYATSEASGVDKYHLRRFTSEGDLDSTFSCDLSSINIPKSAYVVSDHANENTFLILDSSTTKPKIISIGDDGTKAEVELNLESRSPIVAVAVHDNIFAVAQRDNNTKIGLYRYNDGSFLALQSYTELAVLDNLINAKIEDFTGGKNSVVGSVQDIYMKDGVLYVLYTINKSTRHPSFGGLLKYKYSVQDAKGKIEDGVRLVGKEEYKAQNRVANVQDENNELFGACKFVGFSENELYFADDGAKYKYDAGTLHLVQNKNRLIALDLKKDKIIIRNQDSESWLPEEEMNKNIEPILFYSKSDLSGLQLSEYSVSVYTENEAGLSLQALYTETQIKTSIFDHIFDSLGNLYLVTDGGISKYTYGKNGRYQKDIKFTPILWQGGNIRWVAVLYDNSSLDLYFIDSSENLYRYEDGQAKKIETRDLHISVETSVIYGNKLYMREGTSGTFNVYSIEKYDITDNKIDTIDSLERDLEGYKFESMVAYDDVLFICYLKKDLQKTYLASINLKNKGAKHQELNKNKKGDKAKGYRCLGINRLKKEVKFPADFLEIDYDGRILENKNQYASVRMAKDELRAVLHDAPSGITWNDEWDIWKGTKDIMLFDKTVSSTDKPVVMVQYYAKEEDKLNEALSPAITVDSHDSITYSSFCYDQLGNLYILYEKHGGKYIIRLRLGSDGKYNFGKIDSDFDSLALPLVADIKMDYFAMTACYLENKDRYRIYYTVKDLEKTIIKMHEFSSDENFITSQPDASWKLEINDEKQEEGLSTGWKVKQRVTSMVANKDGLFIAVKETKEYTQQYYETIYESYRISVRKYGHQGIQNYNSPLSLPIYIVGKDGRVPTNMYKKYGSGELTYENATWDDYIQETVSDMYAYNGTLYMLTHKRVGARGYEPPIGAGSLNHNLTFSTGAIWKVADTATFSGEAECIHFVKDGTKEERKESGKFSPYRFIAILPRKLFIASDGFYGEKTSGGKLKGTNYNGVLLLKIDSEETGAPETKETKAHFTFKLKDDEEYTSSSWDWE